MKEYYGDNTRWFLGEVIDNSPPSGLEGRVRVRIFGVHSPSTRDIPQRDLPWAQIMVPSTEGGVSGIGANAKIEPGATVFGVFMDGKESQIPLVMGAIPKIEKPSGVQLDVELGILGGLDDVPIRLQTNDATGATDLSTEIQGDLTTTQEDLFYRDSLRYADIDPITSGVRDDILDEEDLTVSIRNARQSTAVKFFLSNGYTIKQSVSIVAGIKHSSNFASFTTDTRNGGIGICSWTGKRLNDLKRYSNQWQKFSVQLSFILYELNTTKQFTNSKILVADSIRVVKCRKPIPRIVATDYLDLKDKDRIPVVSLEALLIYEEYEN